MRVACDRLMELRIRPAYIKVDSTLRGEVMETLRAAGDAAHSREIWLAPSFPDQGRVVADGVLWVNGKPGNNVRTEFERDGLVVFDASTNQELLEIAMQSLGRKPPPLLAGSAGLARQLASLLAKRVRSRGALPSSAAGPAVFIAGTIHEATLRQLSRWRLPRFSFGESLDVVISPIAAGADTLLEYDWSDSQTAALKEFCRLLPSLSPRALFLTGGDTASLVCRFLGAAGIRLADEILPGIPWGRLVGGAAHNLVVVTKSGGFGLPDALGTIRASLPGL